MFWHRKSKVEQPSDERVNAMRSVAPPRVVWPLFPGSSGVIEVALIGLGRAVAEKEVERETV